MSDDQSEEKTDEASDKKLRDLRKKGILPTAPTGSDFFGFGAGLLMFLAILGLMIERLKDGFDTAFTQVETAQGRDGLGSLRYYLVDQILPLLAILLAVAVGVLAFKLLSQGGFIFAMDRVTPKLENVSIVNGVKKLFKGEAFATLAASALRLFILTGVMVGLAIYWGPTLLTLDMCVPGCVPGVFWSIVRAILIAVAVLIVVSIAFDIAAQRAFFLIEQRMTKSEVKRERKEMLGQPEIRQERRRLGRELLESGDVVGRRRAVIFFYAGEDVVAFAFHPTKIPLPKLAARARGPDAAALLRAQLTSQGVPGVHDPEIVAASVTQALGDSAKREIFEPLALHLRKALF